jgi:hypothetical protein
MVMVRHRAVAARPVVEPNAPRPFQLTVICVAESATTERLAGGLAKVVVAPVVEVAALPAAS